MGTHSSTTIATAFTMQSLLVLTCLTLASAAPGHHGHVVPSAALTAQDVPVGKTDVKTAGGEEITVTRDKYIKVKSSAGEAGVVAFDVLATNGVVHLVDTVF